MTKLYNPFEELQLGQDKCFLCGCRLEKNNNNSAEHIFPKWLQKKYNLWKREIALPNETTIKYNQLTIPCCKNCNNTYL